MLPSPEEPITRRMLMARGAAAVGTAALTEGSLAADSDSHPWIDAHSHIWTSDTSQFKLQPGITVENLGPRDFTAEDLMAAAKPQGVGRVVLIQHNVFHGSDNSYLIDAWQKQPEVFRVVGLIDDLRPNCGKAMRSFLKQGITGLRVRPRREISDWLNTDGMRDMWKTAVETRQSMCCLINPEDLPHVDAVCAKNPDTPVVIDHFARIGIDGKVRKRDLDNLCSLAKYKFVRVKISAYYALGHKRPPHHELIPMIKRLYEEFGADRLMWASDCPYQLTRSNTYASSIALIRDVIDFVSDDERKQMLRGTAEETFFFV